MTDCIFCAIVAGEAESDIVYQDDEITAFRDIYPIAPIHVLIVPNRHIGALSAVDDSDTEILGKIVLIVPRLAEQEGIAASGYRLLTNQGPDAGQIIEHLHWHMIGGRRLGQFG
ncbi:MAG: histidine triad nucleotide-binding protein [Anaerolineae bacterium]